MRPAYAEDLNQLIADHTPPCISIYLHTHRRYPGTLEDETRFKNLVAEAEKELRTGYPHQDVSLLMRQITDLTNSTRDFWQHQLEGLAIFCSPDLFLPLQLPAPVDDQVAVADSFHTKPLIRVLQSAARYQVLCLTQRNVRLFEGNQHYLEKVQLHPDVPTDIETALGMGLDGKDMDIARKYIVGAGNPRNNKGPKESGQSKTKMDEFDLQLLQYFRIVDRAIWEHHSRTSNLPLILCALDHYHPVFRSATSNQNLLSQGIKLDPDGVPVDRIRQEAWQVMEPHYRQRIDTLVDAFRSAKAQNLGAERLETVAEAAVMGRVGTLLVDADRHIGGKIDPDTGRLTYADEKEPDIDDVLDDAAEKVLRAGGQVLVIPPDMMPSSTGVAAIYRY